MCDFLNLVCVCVCVCRKPPFQFNMFSAAVLCKIESVHRGNETLC